MSIFQFFANEYINMPRGRPREFNEDEAIVAAAELFWRKGLTATSLDDLARAMKMNRPSIYNAFGNKEAIYRKSLAFFCGQLDTAVEALDQDDDVVRGLIAFFDQAIDVYCGGSPPLGCLMVCTAPSEALSHPEVKGDLKDLIARLDEGFARRLVRAQADGQLETTLDPSCTAQLLQATLQTLALRVRAGSTPDDLRKLARCAVQALIR